MTDAVKCGISFVLGAAVSAAVLNKVFERYYSKKADDEIGAMKEYYDSKYSKKEEPKKVTKEAKKPEKDISRPAIVPVTEAKTIAEKSGYVNYSDAKTVEAEDDPFIEIIPPEACGDNEHGYDIIDLFYNPNKRTLVDERGYAIEHRVERVGDRFVSHFGEFDEDTVYVRNHRMRVDYCICLDLSTDEGDD